MYFYYGTCHSNPLPLALRTGYESYFLESHYLMHHWVPVYIFKRNNKEKVEQNKTYTSWIKSSKIPSLSDSVIEGWESGICIFNKHSRSFCKVIQGSIALGEHNSSSSHTAFILSPDHVLLCPMSRSRHTWSFYLALMPLLSLLNPQSCSRSQPSWFFQISTAIPLLTLFLQSSLHHINYVMSSMANSKFYEGIGHV